MVEPSKALLLCTFLAGCGGRAPALTTVGVLDAFAELHPRVYQVYDVPLDRDAVWTLLDRSFSGEALTEQYVEHWTTRLRMDQEETAIRIARVDHDKVELIDESPGFARVDAAWSVGGVVTHKDHKHPRVNRYRAVYSLEVIEGQWKIAKTRMRDVQRVRSPSRTDGVFDILDETGEQGGGYLDPLDLLDAGVGDDTDTDAVEGEL